MVLSRRYDRRRIRLFVRQLQFLCVWRRSSLSEILPDCLTVREHFSKLLRKVLPEDFFLSVLGVLVKRKGVQGATCPFLRRLRSSDSARMASNLFERVSNSASERFSTWIISLWACPMERIISSSFKCMA